MAYNHQDVLNTCYGILSTSQDSNTYPESLMTSFCNKAQNDICYGTLQNLTTNERLEKQALTFLEQTAFYSSHMFYSLPVDAVAGSSTLTVTNTFTSSGYVWINGNIIRYTGNNGTTLSGIPTTGQNAIQFAHKSGTQIFQLDALPSDFGQVSRIFYTPTTSKSRYELVSIDSRDLTNTMPNGFLYQYFNNYGTSYDREYYYSMLQGRFIFFLVNKIDAQPIMMDYQIKPTQVSTSVATYLIPDDYLLSTVPYLAVSEMLMNRGESEEGMRLNNFGFQNVKSMYQFYATQRGELLFNQRVRTVSDGYLAI